MLSAELNRIVLEENYLLLFIRYLDIRYLLNMRLCGVLIWNTHDTAGKMILLQAVCYSIHGFFITDFGSRTKRF